MPHTKEEWKLRLADKTLQYLVDQTSPLVRGFNGADYDAAVRELVKHRTDQGETIVRHKRTNILRGEDDDVGSRVEMVESGGKGQRVRVVVSKGF